VNREDASSRIQHAVSARNPFGTSRSRSPDAQERLSFVVGADDRRQRGRSLRSDRCRQIDDSTYEGNEGRSHLVPIGRSWGLRSRLRVTWLQTAEALVTAGHPAPHLADGLATAGLRLNDLAARGFDALLGLGGTGHNSRQSQLLNQKHQDEDESNRHVQTNSISAGMAFRRTLEVAVLFSNAVREDSMAQKSGITGQAARPHVTRRL